MTTNHSYFDIWSLECSDWAAFPSLESILTLPYVEAPTVEVRQWPTKSSVDLGEKTCNLHLRKETETLSSLNVVEVEAGVWIVDDAGKNVSSSVAVLVSHSWLLREGDEGKPACAKCTMRGESCEWDTRITFRLSGIGTYNPSRVQPTVLSTQSDYQVRWRLIHMVYRLTCTTVYERCIRQWDSCDTAHIHWSARSSVPALLIIL